MAETHQEVVKVWIEPGCIVCDACEAEAPDVFDVQEETCVIRPDAQSDSFTRPLTPQIIDAAEGCPVDVIKFDLVEVEGPEPWAGQEEEAAAEASAGGGGGAKKKSGPEIPDGPPEPKWAGLLANARTSGSRSGGGPAVRVRKPAKAPSRLVASAIPGDAPPDAQDSIRVGTGFARPKPSILERIRARASGATAVVDSGRRQFNFILLGAWGAMAFLAATTGAAIQAFIVPKVTKEPPSTFRAGKLSDYPDPGVYEQFKPKGVWMVYLPEGKLVALSTTCTHLGCIPNWLPGDAKFKCPCHGSGFYMTGVNFEGPAPRPLERLAISMEGENILVDKSKIYRQELQQWTDSNSYLMV